MKALIAMDCDGTVGNFGNVMVSNGPVPISTVLELADRHVLFIIGNPRLEEFVPVIADQEGGKSRALSRWKAIYTGMDRYVVVDDTPAQYDGGWDGWEFMSPQQFMDRIGEFL